MIRRILIIEGNEAERSQLEILVAAAGYDFTTTSDAESALASASNTDIDLVLCDPEIPGIDGYALNCQLSRRLPNIPIVFLANGTREEVSARALSGGVFDALHKPVEAASLCLCLTRAGDRERLRLENLRLQNEVARHIDNCAIVAASDNMIDLLERLERSAGFQSHVLISGERGTGKEVLARALHQQSPRRDRPFITVDCTRASESQLERELFGAKRGAGSGSYGPSRGRLVESNGGILFFDEIAALPAKIQAELLRVIIEEQVHAIGASKATPIDVRIIAATTRDLGSEVEAGRFRPDLLARLESECIDVPPLRERRQDIPLLVDHFLATHRNRLGESVRRVSDEVLASLVAHDWPGNVRELENLIERAVILSCEGSIEMEALRSIRPLETPVDQEVRGAAHSAEAATTNFALKPARQNFEAQFIRRALAETGGNRTHAAKLLAISHRALLYKIKDYGIRD